MTSRTSALLSKIVFLFALAALPTLNARAASGGNSVGLGSGVAYAAREDALFINPAALASEDKGGTTLRGFYLVDSSDLVTSLVGMSGSVGLGAGWRQSGSSNIFEGGVAVKAGMPQLGLTVRAVGSNADLDAGLNFDLSSLRLAIIARGISGGLDRLDVGLGFNFGQARLDLDIKKPFPLNSKIYLFDAGLAVAAGEFSVAIGVAWQYLSTGGTIGGITIPGNSGFDNWTFHAGLNYQISQNFAIEAHYKPWVQEIGSSDWGAGLRYTF